VTKLSAEREEAGGGEGGLRRERTWKKGVPGVGGGVDLCMVEGRFGC